MIRVDGLTKRYGERKAVDGVSFRVDKGAIIGFLGPNGAGKTTTLRLVTGFLTPDQGCVEIAGIDAIARPLEARRQLGYMAESVPLYKELRVDEYLRYRARLKGVARKRVSARVDAALEMARVGDVRRRIIGQLSKGYRSRVGLADALVADPPLLILDEPTAGLDPNQIRQVRELIRSMAGDKTVLLSTHILPEVESTCERVLIIHGGQLVGEGAPGDLRVSGQGSQLVSLEARGEREQLVEVLSAIGGVRRIVETAALDQAAEPPLWRLRLEAEPRADIGEDISGALANQGLRLRELRREQESLEDIFAQLTTEESRPPSDVQEGA